MLPPIVRRKLPLPFVGNVIGTNADGLKIYSSNHCKLLTIVTPIRYPARFKFEMSPYVKFQQGRNFEYSFNGITPDSRIQLRCRYHKCRILAFVKLTAFLQDLLANEKILDVAKHLHALFNKNDPRILDTRSYDTKTFVVHGEHKCREPIIKNDDPKSENLRKSRKNIVQTPLHCTVLKIIPQQRQKIDLNGVKSQVSSPTYQIQISKKVYFYSMWGINQDFRISIRCRSAYCNVISSINPTEQLKNLIIQENLFGNLHNQLEFSNMTFPIIYDVRSYDHCSLMIKGSHKCKGTSIDLFNQSTKENPLVFFKHFP
jgi:hypothetical protein